MKYLLFIYYSEGEKTENEINEIATELSPIVDSEEIKYVYGPSHAVFNFMTEMTQDELTIYVDIITEDIGYFKYILTPTPKTITSNMDPEHLKHLLDVKGDDSGINPIAFIDFLKESINEMKVDMCNLTVDEILEKIKDSGVKSLTEQEKQKLDNYSQSIQN